MASSSNCSTALCLLLFMLLINMALLLRVTGVDQGSRPHSSRSHQHHQRRQKQQQARILPHRHGGRRGAPHGDMEEAPLLQQRKEGGEAAGELDVSAAAGCSPCGDVYVVRDAGETLQTISALCHVASIEVDNPHISDYDDLAPGAILFISSSLPPCE